MPRSRHPELDLSYKLSYRDLVEFKAERAVTMSDTIFREIQRHVPE